MSPRGMRNDPREDISGFMVPVRTAATRHQNERPAAIILLVRSYGDRAARKSSALCIRLLIITLRSNLRVRNIAYRGILTAISRELRVGYTVSAVHGLCHRDGEKRTVKLK